MVSLGGRAFDKRCGVILDHLSRAVGGDMDEWPARASGGYALAERRVAAQVESLEMDVLEQSIVSSNVHFAGLVELDEQVVVELDVHQSMSDHIVISEILLCDTSMSASLLFSRISAVAISLFERSSFTRLSRK